MAGVNLIPENRVIRLCIESTQAEFNGRFVEAHTLCQQAWEAHQDDCEACIAAHYLARYQDKPEERLHWNQVALNRAHAVKDDRAKGFYPSLYLNMGYSYEILGLHGEAQHYYDLTAGLGAVRQGSI